MMKTFTKSLQNRIILVLCCMMGLMISSYNSYAQSTVRGKVTDQDANPLPGANVLIKGTLQGTTTDANGNYSLEVSDPDATLVFSFIGYNMEEMSVAGKSVVDVVMIIDMQELSEIVVVGYGTQSKAVVTGSVASVKGEDMLKNRTPNVLNSLTGQMPGVVINSRSGEPGREDPTILIRGKSTTGDASPLIIIDGVQRFDLARLNPNDIESVTVLKDASAAIYGARAANGVILVTTKRGSKGKPVFDFSYNSGFSQPTRNPKMANSYTWAQVYNENEIAAGRPAMFTNEEIEKFQAGTEEGFKTINWYNEMTRTWTPQHQFNISTSGGTESVNYYIALGQMTQDGHFEQGSTKIKRYNFRSNIDVKVNKHLTIGLDLSGRLDDKNYPGHINAQGDPDTRGIYSHIYLYHPNWTSYWPGTNYLRPNRDSENVINWVGDNSGSLSDQYKALESRLHFKLDIPQVEGLSISGTANYDVGYSHKKGWSTPTYVYTRTETSPGEYDYTKVRSGASAARAALGEYFDQRIIPTFNTQINYEKNIGRHNVGAMIGYEQMKISNNLFQASRSDFPSAVLDQLSYGSLDKNKQANSGSASITSRKNYFGRVTYNYDHKYLAQLIFRYDGSPQFPEDKRWGFFPGISLGWRISEESFMDNITAIDEMKVRASYGKMGNDNIPPFQYISAYGYAGSNYVVGGEDVIGLTPGVVANPNVTWEVAQTTNLGLDINFLNGALSVQFDYFQTKRSNILTQRAVVIPDYTGMAKILPSENFGEVENKGFELYLSHQKTINKLTYTIGGNISYARNRVLVGNEPPSAEPYQAVAGKPVGARLAYKAIGIFSSQEEVDNNPHLPGARPGDIMYKDVNEDNILNSLDMIRLDQTATPQVLYAINASVRYGNFDFSILFQGQEQAIANFEETLDNLQDKNYYFPVMNNNLGNFLQWRADGRWTSENPTGASQPRGDASNVNNNTLTSTHWIFDAGFLRLKNVELGYSLPSSLLEKLKIQNLRVYVSGNNLLLLKDSMKDLGFDPETTDYWFYPQQRILNIGLNLTF